MRSPSVRMAVAWRPGASTGRRVWDAATGRLRTGTLAPPGGIKTLAFSPDGLTIFTLGNDVRLWDVATGRQLGPPLERGIGVPEALAAGPDGRTVAIGDMKGTARVFDVALPSVDLPRASAWVEVLTGLSIDGRGEVQVLDNDEWLARGERLAALGGPPSTPAAPSNLPRRGGHASTRRIRWSGSSNSFSAVRSRARRPCSRSSETDLPTARPSSCSLPFT